MVVADAADGSFVRRGAQLEPIGLQRHRGRWLALACAALLVLVSAVPTSHSGPISAGVHRQLAALPLPARAMVSDAIGERAAGYRVRQGAGGWTMHNPVQGLTARFTAGGAEIRARSARLGIRLAAVGEGARLAVVPAATASARSNRVFYTDRDVDAWYANGPLGIEQGFTVFARPAGRARGRLTLALALSGNLRPRPSSAGGLLFTGAGGVRLAYRGLLASDARGRRLPARMVLAGGRVLLRIDASSARYPIRIDPIVQQAQLSVSGASLGGAVVAGSTIVAYGTVSGDSSGALYVFTEPASGGWQAAGSPAILTASDDGGGDGFPAGFAISADGSTIVAGATPNSSPTGKAYVFVKPSTGGWATTTETAQLTPAAGLDGTDFGESVALSDDGSTIAVGAPVESPNTTAVQAGVYVFTRPGARWSSSHESAILTPSDGPATVNTEAFGTSVAVDGDGGTIAVGRPDRPFLSAGAVYVYVRSGANWSSGNENALLTASDATRGVGSIYATGPQLGRSVAISDDGDTIAAGGPAASEGTNPPANEGGVYVFVKPASSAWATTTETAKLTPEQATEVSTNLGSAVSISGSTIVATASGASANGGGLIYVFDEPSGGWVSTTEDETLSAGGVSFNDASVSGSTIVGSAPASASDAQGVEYVFGPGTVTVPTPPKVSIGTPQVVTGTEEALSGSVNPEGSPLTDCEFDLDDQSGVGTFYIPCTPKTASGSAAVTVTAEAKGLTAGHSYSVSLVVTAAGDTELATATFTAGAFTSTPPPTTGCATKTVRFTVKIVASGCFQGSGSEFTSTYPVTLNGIEFDPLTGGELSLSTSSGTLSATGSGVIHAGQLELDAWDGNTRFALDTAAGTISFNPAPVLDLSIFGFVTSGGITGTFAAQEDSSPEVTLTGEVTLGVIGAPLIPAAATAVASTDKGLESVTVAPESVAAGNSVISIGKLLPVTGLSCEWQPNGKSSIWTCGAKFSLQQLFGGSSSGSGGGGGGGGGTCNPFALPSIGLTLGLQTNPLAFASGGFSISSSNGGVELTPLIVVNSMGAGIQLIPSLGINGSLGFGLGPPDDPECPTKRPFELTGTFSFNVKPGGDYTLSAGGTLTFTLGPFTTQIAKAAYTQVDTSGSTSYHFVGSAGFSLPAGITLMGTVNADLVPGAWQIYVAGEIGAFGTSLSGQGIVSNKGAGGCGTISIGPWSGSLGFEYVWQTHQTDFDGCDFSGVTTIPDAGTAADAVAARAGGPRAVGALAVGARSVTVPRGAARFEVIAAGAGAPPAVTLIDPHGDRYSAPAATDVITTSGPVLMVRVASTHRTYFDLDHPLTGRWRVVPEPGAAAPTAILVAQALEPTHAHAAVARDHGVTRLRFTMRAQPGVSVAISERVAGGATVPIGTETGSGGTLTFTPAIGKAGRRALLGQIYVDGVPRGKPTVVGSYVAPSPAVPRVRDAHYEQSGRSLTITWKRALGAVEQTMVELRFRGGDKSTVIVKKTNVRAHVPAGLMLRSVAVISRYDGLMTSTVAAKKVEPPRKKKRRHSARIDAHHPGAGQPTLR